jgi:oligoribonuclease (3'-5' exoribonuclease)
MAADLIEANLGSRMFTVAVGWNVGGFDRQFIIRHMPALNSVLSYRNADLNSMVFKLAGDSEKKYEEIKKAAKEYAVPLVKEVYGLDKNWHDAGYDAAAALFSLEYLQSL